MQISTLEEFISMIVADQREPVRVFSTSVHRAYAERETNDVVERFPEYYNIAYCFSRYPLQKWCRKQRKAMGIDIESLDEAINKNGEYFGLKTHYDMSLQRKTLLITNKIVDQIEKILKETEQDKSFSKAELRAINDIYNEIDSSKYIVCNSFVYAIERLFEKYYQEFDELVLEIDQIRNEIDDDLYLAFHNADNLIYILNDTKKRKRVFDENINYEVVYELVKESIELLKTYPFTKDLFRILKLYLQGNKETNVAEKIGRSRTYVRTRYEEGLVAIESLIWGIV